MRHFLPTALFLLYGLSLLASPVRSDIGADGEDYTANDAITPIEYLESTGTQYLLFPEPIDGIDCWILPQKALASYSLQSIGRFNGLSRVDSVCFITRNSIGLGIYNGQATGPVETYDTSYDRLFHVEVHGVDVSVDGIPYQMGGRWAVLNTFKSAPFALFGGWDTKTQLVRPASCRIGACALYIGDDLIYDLLPARIGREGFMLDTLTGTLYENQGTGYFRLGPDLQ